MVVKSLQDAIFDMQIENLSGCCLATQHRERESEHKYCTCKPGWALGCDLEVVQDTSL